MDVNLEGDWKSKMGFPINYDSGQSTDDDFDTKDVVMRNPRASSILLADRGDGAEADLLGTTPPRSRIRDKEKRRNFLDSGASVQRMIRESRDVVDRVPSPDSSPVSERLRKRSSLKLLRAKERDFKLDMGQQNKADSLPSPYQAAPDVPPVLHSQVESASRFMCLTSKPKSRAPGPETETEVQEPWRQECDEQMPANRVNFHKTFSMLINMGNIDKTCRRTISREEQVWQNELKDLIWLELQARVAGRSLPAQDAWLCAQRQLVPLTLTRICEYRFVNKNPCRRQCKRAGDIKKSQEDLTSNQIDDDDVDYGCLQLDCQTCADAVGQAMREVGALVDSFYNAVSLYPSSKAMTADLPLVATSPFKNRLKAMCLWFNTALNVRLKMLAIQHLLRSKKQRAHRQRSSLESEDAACPLSRQTSETKPRPCTVRFNVSTERSPTESNSSDSGYAKEEVFEEKRDGEDKEGEVKEREEEVKEAEESKDQEKKADCEEKTVNSKRPEDEVDSGVDCTPKPSDVTTPDIVVDSRYSTVDSNDTGYMSDASSAAYDAYDIGPINELTHLVLLNKTQVSMFREHHQEILKTQGVRRCMGFMNKMRTNILYKVFLTLEKPDTQPAPSPIDEGPAEVFHDARDEDKPDPDKETASNELRRYGCWSEECMSMRLPSYRSHFLLLCSISMEAVHDYLSLRLEIKPERPSCLTVKQLMHELRDGLDIATEMRADFVRNVQVALVGRSAGAAAEDLLLMVHTYDQTVETMLDVYMSYLTMTSLKEPMRRGQLQSEWSFVARLARRLKAAHRLAPLTFAQIACNQLDRLHKQFEDKFNSMVDPTHLDNDRRTVYALCRDGQYIFASEREHTLQVAQWARALAARLARAPPPAYVAQRQDIFNSLMAIRDFIVEQVEYILDRSRALAWEPCDPLVIRVRELILQICKLGFELHRELYKFAIAPLEGAAPRARPASLQPERRAPPPRRPRPGTMMVDEAFNPHVGIHKELHRFVTESRSTGGAPAAAPARPPRGHFVRLDSVLDDADVDNDAMQHFNDGRPQTSIELLLTGSQPPEEQVELRAGGSAPASEEEKQWACRVARAVIVFAKCWMKFVVERCDRGRGLRPRWASQGLEFLMLACDPCNTKHLTETEFEELKQLMDGCISHVIGSRPTPDPCAASPRPRHRLHSPLSTGSCGKEVPTPPTPPPSEPDPVLVYSGTEPIDHKQRVKKAIQEVEANRERQLRENKRVGRVVTSTVSNENLPKLRQLTFKWQRGLKIGAGSFGKVYTVVNTESGQLLAMKELSVGADRKARQRAANELRVLEGVRHPHLVRYHGCELHREEMLIFMELCVEGSLEALVATSGALAEGTVRRYSRQLLSAVHALHNKGIAHRDIKSGNIFLTNEGHCLKLGDFGCAVKIRATTTAPNELQGFVGTQAYMAPEVFMKSSGHGRAADIWSVGCVVTEMASGKRPFSEYDSNYQIMFMVGMGSRPAIPSSLSEEGRTFCELCLTHETDLRPRADQLLMHTFLMVKDSDDDCKCETGFLLTNTT